MLCVDYWTSCCNCDVVLIYSPITWYVYVVGEGDIQFSLQWHNAVLLILLFVTPESCIHCIILNDCCVSVQHDVLTWSPMTPLCPHILKYQSRRWSRKRSTLNIDWRRMRTSRLVYIFIRYWQFDVLLITCTSRCWPVSSSVSPDCTVSLYFISRLVFTNLLVLLITSVVLLTGCL